MKLSWWVKVIILTSLWLVLAWLIQRERDKKDREVVGELMFMFPVCDSVPLWQNSLNQSQFDSLLKIHQIDGVIFDLNQQAYQKGNFPDDNFRMLNQAALAAQVPVYAFNPDTLEIKYGWKMLTPEVFYQKDFDYHPYLTSDAIRAYWKSYAPTEKLFMDSTTATPGLNFIKLLRPLGKMDVYTRQLYFSRSFQKQVNELVFRNPYRRWLIMVHQPAHGYSWLVFNNTPRYRVLKGEN